jgi:hypothetical protein
LTVVPWGDISMGGGFMKQPKFCKDCVHFDGKLSCYGFLKFEENWDLVTGAHIEKVPNPAMAMRKDFEFCGYDAKGFHPKP